MPRKSAVYQYNMEVAEKKKMMTIDEIKKFVENNSESKLLTTEYRTSFGRFLAKKGLFY